MQLWERESQLSALVQYAEEARAGQGRLVLLAGEAGVGKSALLEQLERDLDQARWLWGACDGLFTPAALGPLLDVASQLKGDLLRLCRTQAPRDQLFAALLRQLQDSVGLTVLVMEDVHWADEATLDLVRYLARRIQRLPVLLLISYRDDALPADDPLRVVLGALAGQRTTRRLTLPTLSATTVAKMAAGTGVDAGELYRLTSGNAFFVTEVLTTGTAVLPASARDAVFARVAGLSEPAREALIVAALIGSRVPVTLLTAVTAEPTALDELLRCGMLIGDGPQLRFRHEIARVTVQSAVAPHREPELHARILQALLAADWDDEARLAFHAEGAGDTAAVLTYAPSAARRASALAAHREAAAQYARAVRAAQDADVRFRAELSDDLAYELALVDRWQESTDVRAAGLLLWREVGDPAREGDSLRRLSRAMWRLCRGRESEQAAQDALALLEPLGPSKELAWAYANLANHRGNTGAYAEGIALARQTQQLASQLGLDDVLSDALNTEGGAVRASGGAWIDLMRRALDVALSSGHDEQAGRAFANTYTMYCADLRDAEAEEFYVDALAYCEDHDLGTFSICLRGERSVIMERRGQWDEAQSQALALLNHGGVSPVNRIKALCTLAKVRARRGAGEFWPYLDEANDSALGVAEPEWVVLAGLARVEALWLEGHRDAATDELAQVVRLAPRADVRQRCWLALWRHRLAGAIDADLGPIDIEPFASQINGRGGSAAGIWDRLGYRYEAALALLDTQEEAALRESLSRLTELGALAAARLVRRSMRDLGVRSIPTGARPATQAHPRGLTAREQEVLRLVCQGHTNDQISGQLFISVKTVDHHVSAVLAKLGVTSRRAATTEARRLGLVTPADLGSTVGGYG